MLDALKKPILEGKTAVITGCNRGIGKAILECFAYVGADVFAVIRKENSEFTTYCSSIEKKYGGVVKVFYGDFSTESEVKSVAKQILGEKVSIDVLVNNVGTGNPVRPFTMISMDTIKDLFEINLFSSIQLTQYIGRNMMKNRKGSIIFVSSAAAYDGGVNVDYVASKAGVIGAMRSIAVDLGGYGIRVNAVAPGYIGTELGDSMSEEQKRITLERNIMKRKGSPEEIADAVLFLASDMSSFITGQVMRVDGGIL